MDDYKPAIRSATLDDALAIHHLTKHLGYEPSELSDTKYLLKTLLESDRDDVYVALQDTSVIGWIHCFQTLRLGSEGFYEIGGLVVCSTQRRKGIGKALVDYAITQYPGKWRVRCNSLRHETHLFYQKLGFVQCKSQLVFDHQT